MKKSKTLARVLSLVLALAIVGGVGGGCSNSNDSSSSPSSDSASTQSGEGSEEKELVTLEVFAMTSNFSGVQENWWSKILEEDLKIKIDLVPAGDQGEQKLATLMAGQDLPDIVVFKETKQALDAARAGLVIAFDDYIDQIPNVVKNMSAAMEYYADVASEDGKCYSLPSGVGNTPTVEDFGYGPMLRWDLYEKLGYPEIKTIEDYLTILKQMVELEPVNEAGQQNYGLSLWSDWDSIYMNLAGAFGSTMGVSEGLAGIPMAEVDYHTMEMRSMLDEDSAYMRSLRFFFEANQMGLLDPDSITQRYDSANEKMAAGRVMFSFWPWGSEVYSTAERVNAEDYKGFKAIPYTDGYAPVTYEEAPIGNSWSWSVGANSEHIDRALEYINYMADPATTMVMKNGPQGFLWDIDEEGVPYTTDEGYKFRLDVEAQMPGGGKLTEGMTMINAPLLCLGVPSETYGGYGAEYRIWPGYEKEMTVMDQNYADHTGYPDNVTRTVAEASTTEQPLAAKMIAPVPDDIQMIATRIGDVVKNDSWLMVYAADENEYQQILTDMLNKVQDLGIEQLLEYDRQAWQDAMDSADKYE